VVNALHALVLVALKLNVLLQRNALDVHHAQDKNARQQLLNAKQKNQLKVL
jgi:hypothetical protein